MRAHVDHDLCIGCGLCEDTCPGVFALRDGYSWPKDADLDPLETDCAQEASEICPTQAITVKEDPDD